MAITFPKVGRNDSLAGGTSLTASWTGGGSSAAGSIIVVAGEFDPGFSFSSMVGVGASGGTVTDSGMGVIASGGTNAFLKAFLAPAAGITGVTVNYSGNTGFCGFFIWEIAGLTTGVFDQVAGTIAVSSQTTGTLTDANEAAVCFGSTGSAYSAVGSGGWTDDLSTPLGNAAGHQVVSSTAALSFNPTPLNGGNLFIATFKSSGGAPTYQVSGITRDNTGNLIGSCDVFLLKYNSGTHIFTQIAHTVSDATSGTFLFSGLADNAASYSVVAWKDGTPHVFDISDRNITPV